MESYRNVFQQYKDRYCQNSLAQKLLKIQAENEEIERRIRATEEQILEKERLLMAALGNSPVSSSCRITEHINNVFKNVFICLLIQICVLIGEDEPVTDAADRYFVFTADYYYYFVRFVAIF